MAGRRGESGRKGELGGGERRRDRAQPPRPTGSNGVAGLHDDPRWAALRQLVERLAEDAARRYRIADYGSDLAQEGFADLWSRVIRLGRWPQAVEAQACIEQAASRERRHRRRSRPRGRRQGGRATTAGCETPARRKTPDPVLAPQKGIPPLCPQLFALGAGPAREARLARVIAKAAYLVARQPHVLRDGRFRVFSFAYIDGLTIGEIADLLVTTRKIASLRIQRVADRVERVLIAAIASHFVQDGRKEGSENTRKTRWQSATAASARGCAELKRALGALIRRLSTSTRAGLGAY